MNQKVIITRGLSGSGKSTWSKKYVTEHKDFVRISRDDLRFMLHDGWLVENDDAVFGSRAVLIDFFLDEGKNLILDETYLSPKRIKELNDELEHYVRFFKPLMLDIEIKDFIDVPLATCLERNSSRSVNYFVPEKFIEDYYEQYVKPLLKDPGVTKWTI